MHLSCSDKPFWCVLGGSYALPFNLENSAQVNKSKCRLWQLLRFTPTLLRRYFGNKKQTSIRAVGEGVRDKARETGSLWASVPTRSGTHLFPFVFLSWISPGQSQASAAAVLEPPASLRFADGISVYPTDAFLLLRSSITSMVSTHAWENSSSIFSCYEGY